MAKSLIKSYLPEDFMLDSEKREKQAKWMKENLTFLGIDDDCKYYHLDHDVIIPDYVYFYEIILIVSPGVIIRTEKGKTVWDKNTIDRLIDNSIQDRFACIIEGIK